MEVSIAILCKNISNLYERYEANDFIDEDSHLELIEEKETKLFKALYEIYGNISVDVVHDYYSSIQIANLLGWSRQRFQINKSRGKMPKPDIIIKNRPLWSKETVDEIVNKFK